MADFSFTTLGLVSLVLVLVGVIGLVLTRQYWRKPVRFEEGFLPISEWRPTGSIDFVTPPDTGAGNTTPGGTPPAFILRVEDYRILESMAVSGAKRVEFRWRPAALDEAKHVVSRHNASLTTIDEYLPRTIRSPHIVPETEEAADKPPLELVASSSAKDR
ncbi:MAG: hypothetical protein P8Y53_20850 [Pseudolabrys sp.]